MDALILKHNGAESSYLLNTEIPYETTEKVVNGILDNNSWDEWEIKENIW